MTKAEQRVLMDAGVVVTYSTGDVCRIFKRSRQWVSWSLSNHRFVGRNGMPLQLSKDEAGNYIWTPEDVKWAAVSCYNRKTITIAQLRKIIRRLLEDGNEISGKY